MKAFVINREYFTMKCRFAIIQLLKSKDCLKIKFVPFLLLCLLVSGTVSDATFPNVMKSLKRYLHMKITTIHCIVSCVLNVQRICQVHTCSIYTCQRSTIHFLPFKLSANPWYENHLLFSFHLNVNRLKVVVIFDFFFFFYF